MRRYFHFFFICNQRFSDISNNFHFLLSGTIYEWNGTMSLVVKRNLHCLLFIITFMQERTALVYLNPVIWSLYAERYFYFFPQFKINISDSDSIYSLPKLRIGNLWYLYANLWTKFTTKIIFEIPTFQKYRSQNIKLNIFLYSRKTVIFTIDWDRKIKQCWVW